MMLDPLWRWAGFREARATAPQTWGNKGYGGSNVLFPLCWQDRLRVLISGKIMVDMIHSFDRPPKRWETISDVAVLPPGYSIKGK